MEWLLHEKVQPILDEYRGRTIAECYQDAIDHFGQYAEGRAIELMDPDELRRERTIWEAVWALFYQQMRDGRSTEIW